MRGGVFQDKIGWFLYEIVFLETIVFCYWVFRSSIRWHKASRSGFSCTARWNFSYRESFLPRSLFLSGMSSSQSRASGGSTTTTPKIFISSGCPLRSGSSSSSSPTVSSSCTKYCGSSLKNSISHRLPGMCSGCCWSATPFYCHSYGEKPIPSPSLLLYCLSSPCNCCWRHGKPGFRVSF